MSELNQDAERAAQEYARVREEFELATKLGARFDIDSAMLNVDALLNARRAAPVGEVELPALPEPLRFAQWTGGEVFAYTAEQVRQAQRQAYEAGKLAAIADSQREVASDLAAIKARLAAAQQPAQSIGDDTKFRELVEFWSGKYHSALAPVRAGYKEAWAALIAYIDGRTAGAAPEVPAPQWAGEFKSFADWVNRAQRALASPSHLPAICVDAKGRRCTIGKDFMLARDEGAFPVRYFWEFAAAPSPQQGKEGGK